MRGQPDTPRTMARCAGHCAAHTAAAHAPASLPRSTSSALAALFLYLCSGRLRLASLAMKEDRCSSRYTPGVTRRRSACFMGAHALPQGAWPPDQQPARASHNTHTHTHTCQAHGLESRQLRAPRKGREFQRRRRQLRHAAQPGHTVAAWHSNTARSAGQAGVCEPLRRNEQGPASSTRASTLLHLCLRMAMQTRTHTHLGWLNT
jgi:hypothetical protein